MARWSSRLAGSWPSKTAPLPATLQAEVISVAGFTLVPGFIDVHVHGVEGTDVLDDADAVATVAARLPKFGVTAFCPTSVACAPDTLQTFLDAVARARATPAAGSARVLPAHLESNFINPEWNGAQPARLPPHLWRRCPRGRRWRRLLGGRRSCASWTRARDSVAIVTVAPELSGGLDLVAAPPRARAHRVDRPLGRQLRRGARGHPRRA